MEIKCNKCKATGYIPIAPGVRGLKYCDECNGTGIVAYIKEKAREMFKELGYEYIGVTEQLIQYQKDNNNDSYSNIFFKKDEKSYFIMSFKNYYNNDGRLKKSYDGVSINIELNKAINKQIEELGW